MTMEIKVGDKVRVREDAPRIYTQNCLNLSLHNTDFEVANIEDGCANIQSKDCILTIAYVIPTKYLTKVEDEAKAKYKVGDKVRVLGHALLEGCVFTITLVEHREKRGWMYRINTHIWFPESDLEPYTEPKEQAEEQAEEVARIRQLEAELDEFRQVELDRVLHPEKYYTYEVTVDNVAMDWQRYEADLAKEIAVKLSNPNENKPGYVADYAVSVAKAVVENLKKK